jgi:hypothetical protein
MWCCVQRRLPPDDEIPAARGASRALRRAEHPCPSAAKGIRVGRKSIAGLMSAARRPVSHAGGKRYSSRGFPRVEVCCTARAINVVGLYARSWEF